MSDPLSERRMAENEVFFRQRNEAMQKSLEEFRSMALEHGQHELIDGEDTPLYFYCECADEDCRKRIEIRPSVYDEIHKNRRKFIVVCGHETPSIEHIIERNDDFCVVKKKKAPPATASKTNPTPINNA